MGFGYNVTVKFVDNSEKETQTFSKFIDRIFSFLVRSFDFYSCDPVDGLVVWRVRSGFVYAIDFIVFVDIDV